MGNAPDGIVIEKLVEQRRLLRRCLILLLVQCKLPAAASSIISCSRTDLRTSAISEIIEPQRLL